MKIPKPTIKISASDPIKSSLGIRSFGGLFNAERFAASEAWLGPISWTSLMAEYHQGPGTMHATVAKNLSNIPTVMRSRFSVNMAIPLTFLGGTKTQPAARVTAHTPEGVLKIRSLLADTASGKNDKYYAQSADCIKHCGLKRVVVRLGHESGGAWYPWSAIENEAAYIAAFRHVRNLMSYPAAVGETEILFEYNLAAKNVTSVGKAAYPGDDVVDVIGLDTYYRPTSRPYPSAWDAIIMPTLAAHRDMAQAHRKPMSFAEWASTGVDEPRFIDNMADWFGSNLPMYQAYFGGQDRYNLSGYPKSQARFKARFGQLA